MSPGTILRRTRELALALMLLPAAAVAAPAESQHAEVAAVETDGKAVLRICRDGFIFSDCRIYGHIDLPRLVKQDDVFPITFGSNPKRIRFKAEHIYPEGAGCNIIGSTGDGKADRLTSDRCRPVDIGTVQEP